MQIFQPVREEIRNYYYSWDTDRQQWLPYAKENKELFLSDVEGTKTTYKDKQKKHINDSIGITSSINTTFSTISQSLALALKTKPSHKIVSVDGRGKDIAQVLEKAKLCVLQQSKEKIQTEECLKDVFTTGLGFKFVFEDGTKSKRNIFGVKSKYIPFDKVLVDSNVTDRSFEDEEGFFLENEMTIANVKKHFPDIVDRLVDPDTGEKITDLRILQGSYFNQNTDSGDMVNKLEVREFWQPYYTTMYLINTPNGDVERVFKENLDEEQATLLGLDESFNEEMKRSDIYYKRILIFGNYEVDEEVFPQTYSPLTKYFYEWAGKPYKSYGMIHWIKGLQEGTDAMIRLFILNGILSNNKGYRAAIDNIPPEERDNWEKYATDPTKLKLFEPVEYGGKLVIPEQERVEPLSAFFPTILELLEKGKQDVTGMYPYMSGDPSSGKIEVFSSLNQYQNTAMQRPQMILNRILEAEESHGNALTELLIDNLKPNKNYFFFNDKTSDIQEFTIANDLIQSLKVFDYYVMTEPGQAMSNQREATAEALMQIAQTTTDEIKRDLYIDEAISLKEIPRTKTIREKTDIVKNSQQKVKQLEEQIKETESLMKQLRNRTVNAETRNMVLEKAVSQLTQIAKESGGLQEIIKETKSQLTKNNNGENNE